MGKWTDCERGTWAHDQPEKNRKAGKRGETDAGPTRDGGVRSPPPSFDAVLSYWRIHFQPGVTPCRVLFQSLFRAGWRMQETSAPSKQTDATA